MRDKLAQLLEEAEGQVNNDMPTLEQIADYLIEHGVIVPPCKVGQMVYVLNQTEGKVYQNTVVYLKIRGKSKLKNTIGVEYINKYGETSCRKFAFAQIGKQVFFSREEAEKALAERSREGNRYMSRKAKPKNKFVEKQPTADVAPKSKFAREIFEDIENLITNYFAGILSGVTLIVKIAELKKKYMEGATDEQN